MFKNFVELIFKVEVKSANTAVLKISRYTAYMIASSTKIISKHDIFSVYQLKLARFVETYAYVHSEAVICNYSCC